MNKKFSDEQAQYIKDNYLIKSYKEIAEELGFTEKQIRGKVTTMGLRKLRTINKDYFSSIDTPIKAYFLGFLYADGWVVSNELTRNYELGLQLQSCDKYVLEKLNEELGNKNIITHINPKEKIIDGILTCSNHSDVLRIYSKKIVTDLISHGVETNKTQKTTFPIVNDALFFDYLRGYIDGDGCFHNNKNGSTICHITCSSPEPLLYLQNKLIEYDIYTKVYQEKERKYRLICYEEKSICNLVNRLYYEDGLFYLTRKYEKISSLLKGSAA